MKRKFYKLGLCGALVALALTGCRVTKLCTGGTSTQTTTANPGAGTTAYSVTPNSQQLTEAEQIAQKKAVIDDLIDQYFFFDQPDEEKEEAYMYKGLIASLGDQYSAYYTPEELQDIMESDSGVYEGIGVSVTQDASTKVISVVRVFDASGALDAGIKPKDQITKVNGEDIKGEDLSAVVSKMRGTPGTTVDITVYRPSTEEELTMTVERRKIENASVNYRMMDGKIGYILVNSFDENTDQKFDEAVTDLEHQGMQSLIIDLRDNPGGYVFAAGNMCNRLIDSGVIVTEQDRDGNVIDSISADANQSVNVPIVLLVNDQTASSAEIMAGCLKDHGKAKLIGTKTYGKGIIQQTFPLSDGSAVKLTIATYFTPSGANIHEKGIEPDIVVELPEELKHEIAIPEDQDTQLQRAVEELGGKIK